MSVEISANNLEEKSFKDSSSNDFPSQLELIIQSIVEKEGFITYNIEKKHVSTSGANYLGVLYNINIKGSTKDGGKELNLFLKNNIIDENNAKIFNASDLYNNEIFVYKELSEVYEELQEDYNIPLEERYRTAKIYGVCKGETLIMENLTKKGYTTYHRTDVVSLQFAELAIKTLARFHGLSFVLKEKRPEYFEAKIRGIKACFHFGSDSWNGYIKSTSKMCQDNLDEEFQEIVQKKVHADLAHKFERYLTDEASKLCLCHGDYRPNNIMTHFKDGQATDVIPVDYQLIYFSCPIFDFLFFIFTCTDRAFRKAHLVHLKELYHETLSKFLRYFDMDVDSVFPKEEFEEMYKDKLDYGLMIFTIYMPFILASDNDIPDASGDMAELDFQLDETYRPRIRDAVEDYIEWGYL